MKTVIGILLLTVLMTLIEYPFVLGTIQLVTSKIPGK